MTTLLNGPIAGTLEQLVSETPDGSWLEAWTFDDRKRRQDAERALKERGVQAKIRSAYKPPVHAFLEEFDLSDVTAVRIHYPVHDRAEPARFRLEAYPLAALLEGVKLEFIERPDGLFHYDVEFKRSGASELFRVFAPNRLHVDAVGEVVVSPTGWMATNGNTAGSRLETDYERVFRSIMDVVREHDWGPTEPFFEELNITVRLPLADEPFPVGDEIISLREALHEDLYFSILEYFQKSTGRNIGDRDLRPGQIVPEILQDPCAWAEVQLRPLSVPGGSSRPMPCYDLKTPLSAGNVAALLAQIGGYEFVAATRSGRTVAARYVRGSDRPVMISGGQHPNEVTGISGAIFAGLQLAEQPGAHFFLSPLENPDGQALHERLALENPCHMHHAARYTAYGDDFEWRQNSPDRTDTEEKSLRWTARSESGAELHVNLHGYPSHEWTRPLTGYIPRKFPLWSLPKGYFLIVRYYAGWQGVAEKLITGVTERLASVPGLLRTTERQLNIYRTHAGSLPFTIVNGFPCMIVHDDGLDAPVTLITEYPDETIHGQRFVEGTAAQREAVVAAYDTWQAL